VQLDDGTEAGLFLPRGTVLRQGDRLRASNGKVILIRAAAELVSTVTSSDPLALARAAYHLGNRHVALQIESDRLHYLHDHVLDAMLEQIGLSVIQQQAPFEPEAGAYDGGHQHHH
jgi:urease accessory protein